MILIDIIAGRLSLTPDRVAATVELLDGGATVPFISRYRKEATGGLNEVEIRDIEIQLKATRELLARKEFVTTAIEAAGAMTPAIESRISEATTPREVEDIYAPFKPRKRTRATMAREKGLEPLAKMIMGGNVADCSAAAMKFARDITVDEAIGGASDIIAEWASESTRLRNITRHHYRRSAALAASVAKGRDEELAVSPFAQYAGFSKPVRHMASHQYLALKRAEAEGFVKLKYTLGNGGGAELDDRLTEAFVPRKASSESSRVIASAVADAARRLLMPSVENEVSAQLKEEADRVAIGIFSENLRQLLLASPLKGRRVLALDPGYRTGCKVVALDAQGNLLDDAVIYPVEPRNDTAGAVRTLATLISRHRLDAVAIGNGTASRETERFVKASGLVNPGAVYVVSENGASVYSASEVARREFPDKDVTVRGAVSIGRRLIDPLAELVKIDPKSIGVGQYQHDVDQTALKNALDFTVMSCVNAVGVDVNTASRELLAYVSGIGPALAANIVAYRSANGDFTSRRQLLKVPRLGDKAFEQAAGFLRIPGAVNPLDNTGIHPESYHIVEAMARRLKVRPGDLVANGSLLDTVNPAQLAAEGIGGAETIADIVTELRKPGRDPRTDDSSARFQPGVESFGELAVGQILPGLINNITAFGAFVDLGIKENGLIHISQLSPAGKRVNSVADVVKLGQQVLVKVIDVDAGRRRIGLSLAGIK